MCYEPTIIKSPADDRSRVGTVVHGTHRDRDLLRAFADELERVSTERTHVILAEHAHDLARRLGIAEEEGETYHDLNEEASETVYELVDALNELAPEGLYFGAHPGDGADFGYWPTEE